MSQKSNNPDYDPFAVRPPMNKPDAEFVPDVDGIMLVRRKRTGKYHIAITEAGKKIGDARSYDLHWFDTWDEGQEAVKDILREVDKGIPIQQVMWEKGYVKLFS